MDLSAQITNLIKWPKVADLTFPAQDGAVYNKRVAIDLYNEDSFLATLGMMKSDIFIRS